MLTSLLRSCLGASSSSSSSSYALGETFARSLLAQPSRFLNIHEFDSQRLMGKFGIMVPESGIAETAEEAKSIAQSLNTEDLVIKAQILAGGRGMGRFTSGLKGGVHLCNSPDEIHDFASKMIGFNLVTKQTGVEGRPCNKVMIARRHFIRRESYFAILLNRKDGGAVMIGSKYGGMDIETVAHETPEAIFRLPFSLEKGITAEQARNMAINIGFPPRALEKATEQILKLQTLFVKTDATQVEVNPFVETSEGHVMCVDAKINFDDNASYRQKEIFTLRDFTQEDSREVAAAKFDLNFIGLDGSIGCLVNGAGLAMATMDVIKLHGGSPANFLDIGGGASESQVTEALKLIASDKRVKAILINIFGGIMRCDIIVSGIQNAVRTLNLDIPLVVRLEGTNSELAKEMVRNSGLKMIAASDLEEAAKKAVSVAKIVEFAQKADLHISLQP